MAIFIILRGADGALDTTTGTAKCRKLGGGSTAQTTSTPTVSVELAKAKSGDAPRRQFIVVAHRGL